MPSPMPSRLVLFDCDGTLIESHGAVATAMRLAFVQHRCVPPPPGAIRSLVGLSADAMVHVLCQDLVDPPEAAILDSYLKLFRREALLSAGMECIVPGMRCVVESLSDTETMVGLVASECDEHLERALSTVGLGDAFTVRATCDDAPSKPAPDLVHVAVLRAQIPISQTVVVGDTVFDVLMARAAGARVVGVTWGAHSANSLRLCGADIVVDRPDRIPEAVDRLVPSTVRARAAKVH